MYTVLAVDLFDLKFIETEVTLNTTKSASVQPTFLNTVGAQYLLNEKMKFHLILRSTVGMIIIIMERMTLYFRDINSWLSLLITVRNANGVTFCFNS